MNAIPFPSYSMALSDSFIPSSICILCKNNHGHKPSNSLRRIKFKKRLSSNESIQFDFFFSFFFLFHSFSLCRILLSLMPYHAQPCHACRLFVFVHTVCSLQWVHFPNAILNRRFLYFSFQSSGK